MKQGTSEFFLVREEILPEAIKKTIRVKELLKKGGAKTINEAVVKMDLSRSAYYKYKDYVFPFYEATKDKTITLALTLDHSHGVLARILSAISEEEGNIITINQAPPLHGLANVTVSVDTGEARVTANALIEKIEGLAGVNRVDIVGQE